MKTTSLQASVPHPETISFYFSVSYFHIYIYIYQNVVHISLVVPKMISGDTWVNIIFKHIYIYIYKVWIYIRKIYNVSTY